MFRKPLLKLLTNLYVALVIDKIEDEKTRESVAMASEPVFKIGDVLTDKDPNDKEQLRALWKKERGKLLNWSLEELKEETSELFEGEEGAVGPVNEFLTDIQEKIKEKWTA